MAERRVPSIAGWCLLSWRLSPGEMSQGQMSPGHLTWGLNVPCAVGVLAPAMAMVLPGKASRLGQRGRVGPGPWCHPRPCSVPGPAPGRGQAGSPLGRAGAAGMVVSSASPRCRVALVPGFQGRWVFLPGHAAGVQRTPLRDAPPVIARCQAGHCGDRLGTTFAAGQLAGARQSLVLLLG